MENLDAHDVKSSEKYLKAIAEQTPYMAHGISLSCACGKPTHPQLHVLRHLLCLRLPEDGDLLLLFQGYIQVLCTA